MHTIVGLLDIKYYADYNTNSCKFQSMSGASWNYFLIT